MTNTLTTVTNVKVEEWYKLVKRKQLKGLINVSFNSFRDNYPAGFDGLEGEEEEIYLFDVGGEVEIRSTSEEYARKEFLNMTIKEALDNGLMEG